MEISPQHRQCLLEHLCVIFGNPVGQLESWTAMDFQGFGTGAPDSELSNTRMHKFQMKCKTQGDGQ
jgi:hypothetical protein